MYPAMKIRESVGRRYKICGETLEISKPNKHMGFDKFKIGGLSIKLFIEVSPLYVSEGCPQNYLSEYVHYLFQRVVHKIIYQSMSTICIGGLSTKLFIGVCRLFILEGCPQVKQISLFWKRFSYMAQACVRESVRTRGMGLGM